MLRGFPAVHAAALGRKPLAARKRRDLEYRLKAEGRGLVGLLLLRRGICRLARRVHD